MAVHVTRCLKSVATGCREIGLDVNKFRLWLRGDVGWGLRIRTFSGVGLSTEFTWFYNSLTTFYKGLETLCKGVYGWHGLGLCLLGVRVYRAKGSAL